MVELSGTTETRMETYAGISYYTENATNQDTEGSEKDKHGLHSWQQLHPFIVFLDRTAVVVSEC